MLAENQVNAAQALLQKDAGEERVKLTERALDIMHSEQASCYADLYDMIRDDVELLAVLANLPSALVMASLIDDIQAQSPW